MVYLLMKLVRVYARLERVEKGGCRVMNMCLGLENGHCQHALSSLPHHSNLIYLIAFHITTIFT